MLQPRGPWTIFLLLLITSGARSDSWPRDGDRGRRDTPDVTTVLLVGGGRFQDKPEGLLSSTARTFVQEGTTTEYATHVLGTRLDHGRVYAQVLSTSSRVFFDGRDVSRKTPPSLPSYLADIVKPTLVFPVHQPLQTKEPELPLRYTKAGQVFPTQTNEPKTSLIQSKYARTGDVITVSAIKPDIYRESDNHFTTKDYYNKYSSEEDKGFVLKEGKQTSSGEEIDNLLKAKKMDVFNKRNVDKQAATETQLNDLKPAKVVRPLDELPTLTVRHDFSPSGFSTVEEEEEIHKKDYTTSRFRTGKNLFRTGLHKPEIKKLDTVTYMGFADFTTTVGDTVIVFMPNTAIGRLGVANAQGRKATTITGDATLQTSNQQHTSEPIRVVTSVKTFMSHSPGMVTRTVTGHSLSMQTALPTMVVLPETQPSPPAHPRDQKGFDPVYVVQAVTEQLPVHQEPDEETKNTFLAREQESFANTPERDTEAPILTDYIEPSINVDDPDITSVTFENTESLEPSSIQYELTDTIEPSSVLYELPDVEPSEVVTEPITTPVLDEDTTEPEPSETEEYRPATTTPLESYRTAQTQLFPTGDAEYPLGLIKAIGGTEAINGTTTLFTSLVYGTNINGDYAQVIHSTSNIYYCEGDNRVTLEVPKLIEPSTIIIHTQSTSIPTQEVTTPPPTVPLTEGEIIITTEENSISTFPQGTTESVGGTTGGDKVGTTFQDDTLSTLPMEETTTPEVEISNEVETGRKINSIPKDQVVIGINDILPQGTPKDHEIPTTTPKTEEHTKDTDVGTTVADSIVTTPADVPTPEEVIISSGDFITRLVPTTVYKTFTYLTTFFLPAEGSTSTSVRSREVVNSEISQVTHVVRATVTDNPTELFTSIKSSAVVDALQTSSLMPEVPVTPELPPQEQRSTQHTVSEEATTTPVTPTSTGQDEEEVELIYKTLYTTYTYFTTFFEDSTTSIASREEVVTNVMTSTVGQDFFLQASDPAVAGLFDRDDNLIASTEVITTLPTSVGVGRPTEKFFPDSGTNPDDDLFSSVIDSVDIDNEMRATPSLAQDPNVIKTFYTTYTYFTTIFVDGETTISSRTEVYTNVVSPSGVREVSTDSIVPTSFPTLETAIEETLLDDDKVLNVVEETPTLRSPKIEYSSTITRDHNKIAMNEIDDHSDIISSKPILGGVDTAYKNTAKYESEYATISRVQSDQQNTSVSIKSPIFSRGAADDQSEIVVHSMSSSSDGGESIMLEPLDDQISSESNTEELHPSPTLLLQTSYTTFTYFTTIYKGSTSSDIVSRLETVTNVVTETISPQRTILPSNTVALEDSSLPITYFTTYTYWTTLYKEGTTVVTSREETVSNVVTPSLQTMPTSSIEITPTATPQLPDPITYYTTFTYFTTSYIGNSTILNSRLETVTNIVNSTDTAENDIQAGRAIGTSVANQELIGTSSTKTEVPTLEPTGLLSTVINTIVENGITTLFSTDVYGTYIDGLYAKVLESTTQVITPTPTPQPTLPTGVVSLNEGQIIDADGVSTIYFTTQAIGTIIDNLYAQVIESTTSLRVDTARQSEILAASPSTESASKSHKTGLVRLIAGSIVQNQTTTFYESRVLGTLIDGRYAQIIESTSSFKVAVNPTSVPVVSEIAVTSTLSPDVAVTSTDLPSTTPSAVVIESSISEDGLGTEKGSEEEEDHEHESEDGEDDDDDKNASRGKGRVKSRISFSPPKKTFTPQIRPFASRNRQPFNPSRRKPPAADSATTITRTKLTPTITATPAAKPGEGRGRFSGNRRTSSQYYSSTDVKPTAASGSRKYSRGRGTSSAGNTFSSSYGTARGRSSGRIAPTATSGPGGSSRRGNFRSSSSIRGSSVSLGRGSSSPGYFGGRSSRFSVRPTQVNARLSPTNAYTTPPIDVTGDFDEFGTTLMTEETPQFTDNEFETPTLPLPTTTESSRRANPLLRFRRPPLNRGAQTSASTARPTSTTARKTTPSRNNNRLTTTSRPTTRARPTQSNRYSPISNRPRPANSLFPPRGLFRRPGQDEEEEEEKNEEEENNGEEQENGNGEEEDQQGDEEDIGDNDYEGSERKEKKTAANRRVGPSNTVQIKPFVGFNRRTRTKRQASRDTTPRSYTSRFRRPGSGNSRKNNQPVAQERIDIEEEPKPLPDPPKPKSNGRYSGRSRSQSQQTNQPRVKPTAASASSSRSQFTLRENKDSTTSTRSGYRRPSNTGTRRRANKNSEATTTVARPKPPRLRTQQKESSTHTRSGGRQRYSNGNTNTNTNTNTNSRRNTNANARSRYRTSETPDLDTYTFSQSTFDGTITVTHHIPTEVTIPVVNGKVTEYRNVVTASASTEVLGPHQYSTAFAKDGNTLLMLTSEVTGTLPSGVTEVTQFVLHETPTTSVTFTPTTIRGRKTSFSHVIPSTVYDVEQVVNTIQPQIAPNAPLANILLSQLLLGNLGGLQQNLNPLLALSNAAAAPPPTPTTEYKTRATTYVTTVTKGTSTVIPLTFRGKQILTTIVDSSEEVITATEFITDTVVITPTATLAANNQLNSLLIPALLQAQLLGNQGMQAQQTSNNPLLAGFQPQNPQLLQQAQLLQDPQKNLFPDNDDELASIEEEKSPSRRQGNRRRQRPSEETDRHSRESEGESSLQEETGQNSKEEDVGHSWKPARKKSTRGDRKPPDPPPAPPETSVVTLYVSGRRPGEFSTVVSTVTLGEESNIRKRDVTPPKFLVETSDIPTLGTSFPDTDVFVMSAINDINLESSESETQSLESIVGDVSRYVSIDPSSSRNFVGKLSRTLSRNKDTSTTIEESSNIEDTTSNEESSASNTTSQGTGHFLLNGAAESAPLKRKGATLILRGHNTPAQQETSSLNRKKRSTSTDNTDNIDNTDSPSKQRKRIRIRVPIHRKKASHENEKEVLSLSEAQQMDRVTDMELEDTAKEKQSPTVSLSDYGKKLAKEDTSQNKDHHRKRIIVTRRRKPLGDQTSSSELSSETSTYEKESKITKSSERRRITITKKRPVAVTPSTTRRRIVVTKKRPVTPKAVGYEEDIITPTSVTERTINTDYLYKYSVLKRTKPAQSPVTKLSSPPPRFMSGNIPAAFRVHLNDDDNDDGEEESTAAIDTDLTAQREGKGQQPEKVELEEQSFDEVSEEYKQVIAPETLSSTIIEDDNTHKSVQEGLSGLTNEEVLPQFPETPHSEDFSDVHEEKYDEFTEINDEENMTDRDDFKSTTSSAEATSPTNVRQGHAFDSPVFHIKPFLERPYSNKALNKAYQSAKQKTTSLAPPTEPPQIIEEASSSLEDSNGSTESDTDIVLLEMTQDPVETTTAREYSISTTQEDFETTRGKADFIEPPTTTSALPTEGTTSMDPNSGKEEVTTVSEDASTDKIDEETTTTSEESVIVTTPESTYEGPRYIRPTRFSVTRRPPRTKATFLGQRRRASSTSSVETAASPSSSRSYRYRKPTSTRAYGRLSRTKSVSFIAPTTATSEELATQMPTIETAEDTSTTKYGASSIISMESMEDTSTPPYITTPNSTTEDVEDTTPLMYVTMPSSEVKPVEDITSPISVGLPMLSPTVESVEDTTVLLPTTDSLETETKESTPLPTVPQLMEDANNTLPETEQNLTSSALPILDSNYYPVFTPSVPQYLTRTVTRTRLRTYTYIVTRVAGTEQQVTSTTEVKPHVTTVTITQPLPSQTVVATDDAAARGLNLNPNEARYSLATKVMSNGVELIVAGDKSTLPGEPDMLRILSSSTLRPTTLAPSTLTDHMMLLLPQEVTQTFLTTYTYMTTFLHGGTTSVTSREHVVTSVATGAIEGPSEVHMATTLSSTITQTTDVVSTYFVTYTYYSTYLEGGSTVVKSEVSISSEVMTDKVFVPPKRTSSPPLPVSVTATQVTDRPLYVFATKTYLTTFTYFTTLLQDAGHDKTSTIIKSRTRVVQNVVTDIIPPSLLDSDYLLSVQSSLQAGTPIVAMTTMVGGQAMTITAMESLEDMKPTSTLHSAQITPTATVTSSMEEHNNIITGSTIIFFDEDDLLDSSTSTSPTPSLSIDVPADHSKTPTPALSLQTTFINTGAPTVVYPVSAQALTSTTETDTPSVVTSILPTRTVTTSGSTISAGEQVIMMTQANGNVTMIPISDPANKKPSNNVNIGPGGSEIQVSDLLSLGSLGINGFNALGPVINAMAGLIQSNIQPEVHRRNDSRPVQEERPHPVYVPSTHEPIYIPVGGLAGDSAGAESQNYEGIVNLNGEKLGWKLQGDEDETLYSDTELRHRPVEPAPVILGRPTMEKPLLGDGIPISPGEVITANSDVIVGKPAIMGPRPPKIDVPLGMRPPPLPHPAWNKPPPTPQMNIQPLHAPEHDPAPFPMPETSPDFVGLDRDPVNHHGHIGTHFPIQNGNSGHHKVIIGSPFGHHEQKVEQANQHKNHNGATRHPVPDYNLLGPLQPDNHGPHINVGTRPLNFGPPEPGPHQSIPVGYQGDVHIGSVNHKEPKPGYTGGHNISLGHTSYQGNGIPSHHGADGSFHNHKPNMISIPVHQVSEIGTLDHHQPVNTGSVDANHVTIGSESPGIDIILHAGSLSNHAGTESNTVQFHGHQPVASSGGTHNNQRPLAHHGIGNHQNSDVVHHSIPVREYGIGELDEDPLTPHGIGTVLDVPKDTGTRMDPPEPVPTGINVEVTPGQGFNVEISPGHIHQHGISEHNISPSGIVLDVPLTGRPHRPSRPHNYLGQRRRPMPHRPTEFMTPPPPPPQHNHFSGGNGPVIIPLNPNSPQIPRPRPEDLVITNHNDKDDQDDSEEPAELDDGEVIQASNSRPLRPGQVPHVDVDEKPLLQRPHPTSPTHLRPIPTGFAHHQHTSSDKPHVARPEVQGSDLSKIDDSSHLLKPVHGNVPKPFVTSNYNEQSPTVNFDNSHHSQPPEVGNKPQLPLFNNAPVGSNADGRPVHHNHHNAPVGSNADGRPVHHNHHNAPVGSNADGRPVHNHHQYPSDIELEMVEIDKPPKPPKPIKPLLDLETQANTPRPYLRPTNYDHDAEDDFVMGLSPPPPNVAVSSNSGIRFPGVDESTHRPVVNIGGQRRPVLSPRPKPRPPSPSQPPYKVEISTTTPTTVGQKPRPPIYEIPGPSSIPIKEQETAEQNIQSTVVPITTHRPHLRPRPRPRPRPSPATPSSEEVLIIGKPVTIPPATADAPPRKPVTAPALAPAPPPAPSRITPDISPTSVKDIPVTTSTSTIRRPVIAPSSVRTTTAKIPTSTSQNTPELYSSKTDIRGENKYKTPSVDIVTTQKLHNTLHDDSVFITSGSKTIFSDLETKSTHGNFQPSQTITNNVQIHTVDSRDPISHPKPVVSIHESDASEEPEDDDDSSEEIKKNDLGVASSNDETIIYDAEPVVPTRYLTHTQTLTVTTTETIVLSSEGQKPSTLTVVLTNTHTSTIIDTVTETQTLVKPTSVISTVTTTVSAITTTTQYPSGSPYEPARNPPSSPASSTPTTLPVGTTSTSTTTPTSTTEQENESMFVVVNDQRPGSGDDTNDVARHDEADGVNHAVLLGGVLVAAPPRHNAGPTASTASSSCRPDCSPARNERCQRVEGHMRCVCRPGFARMFPDRPCKPTYTYSMRLGLGHLGLEPLRYEPALEEPGGPRFQQLAEASRQGLDRMVMQSDLRDIFHGVAVSGFQPAPQQERVVVNFYVQLSDNTDEARLKDVFRKSLRTSNYSLGGTQLYADKDQIIHLEAEDFDECENPRFHDCSENARCFNLRGTYTCSCKEGFADLSENKLFPGRVCSAELVGCEQCHYHGTCYSRGDDQLLCECFQWYAGENCHINLKVLLIALVTIGAILLALLLACILLTCLKRTRHNQQPRAPGFLRYRGPPHGTLDKRAMILDTSSEGSGDNIPPPPIAYMTPTQQPASTFSTKLKQQQSFSDQRDRSLTVMIPRAKYRPVPPTSPLLTMSTFGAEEKRAIAQEQKLLAMLEPGKKQQVLQDAKTASSRKKQNGTKNQPSDSAAPRKSSAPKRPPEEPPESLGLPPGALVSAGFEVSATVGKKGSADSDQEFTGAVLDTLASHGSNFTTLRTADSPKEPEKTDVESQPTTGSGVQELTVSEARSYDETTIQPPTRHLHSNYGSKPSSRNLNNDEAHTMAERDVGSTFLMPQTHLYKPDRGSDISNFDSL